MYQFIFSNLFPKYYSKFNARGIENNIEFTSYYSNYLNQNNIIDWQKNNQFWEKQSKNNTIPPPPCSVDSESDSDIEIINLKKVKKEVEEEKKKQKRLEKKREMLKQKKALEEKLAENTEKLNKTKKYKKL